MTVSSIPNYKPCWFCNADVNQHGGAYCEEFDAYHCNMCDNADGIECVICKSEQIETRHSYYPIGALTLTTEVDYNKQQRIKQFMEMCLV